MAAILNEKEKLIEKDEVKAGFVNVPLKQKQAELGSYFSKVVDSVGQNEQKQSTKKKFKKRENAVLSRSWSRGGLGDRGEIS